MDYCFAAALYISSCLWFDSTVSVTESVTVKIIPAIPHSSFDYHVPEVSSWVLTVRGRIIYELSANDEPEKLVLKKMKDFRWAEVGIAYVYRFR